MRLSFIGSVGVPNRYGGFEGFLESCGPELAKRGHRVIVTCDSSKYGRKDHVWEGVRRVFVPVKANGVSSILHDLVAFLTVFWRSDAVIALGVSGGIWFPLMRLLCALTRTRLVVNVDGIEWRRKVGIPRKALLYAWDRIAQCFAHCVVYDNAALVGSVVPRRRKAARLIAYPGDHVQRVGLGTDRRLSQGARRCLTICRIVPENNCAMLLEAAARAVVDKYTFVGNWDDSVYGRALRSKFGRTASWELLDPVYDSTRIHTIREGCSVYLHGHSVGGTNPSLVEMLFYDCGIAAWDCAFNRATAGDAIFYFSTDEELVELLRKAPPSVPAGARERARELYTRERIARLYEEAAS